MLVKIALLLVVCSFALAADPSPTTCPVGTYFCNGKCEKLKVKLGHTCAVDSDCREANSKCVGLTCQCAEKFESDMYNMSCNWIMYKLGQACPTDSCEVEHSHCNSTSYCSCSDGYAPDSNNTRCDKINRDLKQSCFFSDQCTTNAWCTGGKCACQPGYNASGLTCVLNKAELTESCKIDLNCNGPEAIRYCNSSLKCDCPAGYQVKKDVSGSLACQLNIRAVHESCSISAECTKTAGADQCDTTCECPIHEKYTTNICEQINLGTHCQRDRECVEFASCVYLFTPDGTAQEWICECWPGYIRTDDMKSCVVEDQLLCEPCVDHIQCLWGKASANFSVCNNKGVCGCMTGYDASANFDSCDLKSKNIGEYCVISAQCPEDAYCDGTTHVCTCDKYYMQNDGQSGCVPEMSDIHQPCKDDIQCTGDNSWCSACTMTCECMAGFFEVDGDCLEPIISEMCDRSKPNLCPGNGTCAGWDMYMDTCICHRGYLNTQDNTTCLISEDGPCMASSDCADIENAECVKDTDGEDGMVCRCMAGFMLDLSTNTCSGFTVLHTAIIPTFLFVLLATLKQQLSL